MYLWQIFSFIFVLSTCLSLGKCEDEEYPIDAEDSDDFPDDLEPDLLSRGCVVCRCGITNTNQKIVGGTVADYRDYPWQAIMYFNGTFVCGGSLINNRYVVTAAHCVYKLDPSETELIVVKLLAPDLNGTVPITVERTISKFIIHPNYNNETFDSDIALLKVESPIRLNIRGPLRPICLPSTKDKFAGHTSVVTGYGTTTEGGDISNVLLEVEVPIISAKKCNANTDYPEMNKTITKNMICAGYPEGGEDSCQGDSGGPLQVLAGKLSSRYYLVGIVSNGIGCARPHLPGIYTKVQNYLSWLRRETSDACSCAL